MTARNDDPDSVRAEEFVLAVLNSSPTVEGRRSDVLREDPAAATSLLTQWGGSGSAAETEMVARARDEVQRIIHTGESGATGARGAGVKEVLRGVHRRPQLGPGGLRWLLEGPPDSALAVEFLLAWTDVVDQRPGRLRRCANEECSLFLVDRSRGNAARWCSMATCGNRMKARRHQQRSRGSAPGPDAGGRS